MNEYSAKATWNPHFQLVQLVENERMTFAFLLHSIKHTVKLSNQSMNENKYINLNT